MTREEDIDATLGRILAKTRVILIPLERVHQLLCEFIPDATEAETAAELDFLVKKGWVTATPTHTGSTLRYQLSAEGILAVRRREF